MYLELVLQQVLLVRKFAVEAEQAGLIGGHFLWGLLAVYIPGFQQ